MSLLLNMPVNLVGYVNKTKTEYRCAKFESAISGIVAKSGSGSDSASDHGCPVKYFA